mmetsp:Transcript_70319/g.115582  ORF Transcript_70319/g.115582 Transcript_70319/m.115582 type:complete len:212 (+) Transcript_70319:86-721(+)
MLNPVLQELFFVNGTQPWRECRKDVLQVRRSCLLGRQAICGHKPLKSSRLRRTGASFGRRKSGRVAGGRSDSRVLLVFVEMFEAGSLHKPKHRRIQCIIPFSNSSFIVHLRFQEHGVAGQVLVHWMFLEGRHLLGIQFLRSQAHQVNHRVLGNRPPRFISGLSKGLLRSHRAPKEAHEAVEFAMARKDHADRLQDICAGLHFGPQARHVKG